MRTIVVAVSAIHLAAAHHLVHVLLHQVCLFLRHNTIFHMGIQHLLPFFRVSA